ncbi:MAG: hypothetical protein N3A02_08625 [Rectinema sp.]|nr:hypothetical protein [Rectinema sp.]
MKATKKIALAAILSLVMLNAVFGQAQSKTSATIQITVIVPKVLQFSADFARNGIADITGYLGSPASASRNAFEIRPNTVFNLGYARLVSNLSSNFSIYIQSANGGKLRNPQSGSELPYSLLIGGMQTVRSADGFRFTTCMKTSRDGAELPVSIALADIPATASAGLYSDSLLFNVMAN